VGDDASDVCAVKDIDQTADGSIAWEIAAALEAAHAAEISHSDLKTAAR
jgi:hypothetical protein